MRAEKDKKKAIHIPANKLQSHECYRCTETLEDACFLLDGKQRNLNGETAHSRGGTDVRRRDTRADVLTRPVHPDRRRETPSAASAELQVDRLRRLCDCVNARARRVLLVSSRRRRRQIIISATPAGTTQKPLLIWAALPASP